VSAKENEAIVRRFLDEAYNKGNLGIGDELLTADCVFYTPSAVPGIGGWKRYAAAFLSAFPDLSITLDDVVAQGSKVAARWTAAGSHQGSLRGIAPTGNRVSWVGIAIYKLADGKICEVWGVNDALGIMQQIGAIPS
jgi:predicted ester cyclase